MMRMGKVTDYTRLGTDSKASLGQLMSAQLAMFKHVGETLFVDPTNGADTYDGRSWATAKATLGAAINAAPVNATILFMGVANENGIDLNVEGVSIVGAGGCQKQNRINCTGEDATYNVEISAAYCRLENLYIVPSASAGASVAAITLTTAAQHAEIIRCRLQGSSSAVVGIYSASVGADNVKIRDCSFYYFNTATTGTAIKGVSTGGFAYSGWEITGNTFNSCVNGIVFNAKCCTIAGNRFNAYGLQAAADGGAIASLLAMGIDLTSTSGGGGGGNIVTGNWLAGAYTTALYKANADVAGSDNWYGNYCPTTATTAPYGLSVAVPAAP